MTKVTVQVNGDMKRALEKPDNQFSIASCDIMKRYPKLDGCDEVITTFNFQDRHYIIYTKKDV